MGLKKGILVFTCLLLFAKVSQGAPSNTTNATESQVVSTTTPSPSMPRSDIIAGDNSSLPISSTTPSTSTTLSTTTGGNETGAITTSTAAPTTTVTLKTETTIAEVPTPNANATTPSSLTTTVSTTTTTTGPSTATTQNATEVTTENTTSTAIFTSTEPTNTTTAASNTTTTSTTPLTTTVNSTTTSNATTTSAPTTTTTATTTTSILNPNATTSTTSSPNTTTQVDDSDPYANARSAGIGSFFALLVVVLVVGGAFWYYRWNFTGTSPYLQQGGPFGPLALRPGTNDLSPPPPAPPGNFRFAMGPTNNSTYNLMQSEELRQRSSNGAGFDSSSAIRREPLRAAESFDPFDPRSNDEGSEGQFVNKTDTIIMS